MFTQAIFLSRYRCINFQTGSKPPRHQGDTELRRNRMWFTRTILKVHNERISTCRCSLVFVLGLGIGDRLDAQLKRCSRLIVLIKRSWFFPFSSSLTTSGDNMTSRLFLYSLVLIVVFAVDKVEMQWGCRKCAVGPWGPWSPCTRQLCGVESRIRSITTLPTCGSTCPTLVESRPCNAGCYHGGTLIPERNGECSCPNGYSGKCCSQIDGKHNL